MRHSLSGVGIMCVWLLASCQESSTEQELAASVSIQPAADTLSHLGQVKTFSASVLDRRGARLTNAQVQWSSTNEAVARVDASGGVTAVSVGTTEIIARVDTTQSRAVVVVRQVVAQIALSAAADTLDAIGAQMRLAVTATDAGSAPVPSPQVTWTSSDPSVIAVDANGSVTALRTGTAEIIATVNGVTARKSLVVYLFGTAHIQIRMRGNGKVLNAFEVRFDSKVLSASKDTTIVLPRILNGGHNVSLAALPNHCMGTPDRTNIATTPGDTTTITLRLRCVGDFLYEHIDISAIELRYMDAFGRSLVLVPSGIERQSAVWSPDGQRVAYARNVGGNTDIFVMDLATRSELRLTNHPDQDFKPTWSPDGRFIAHLSRRPDFTESIYVLNSDGTGSRHILDARGNTIGPNWSPRGDLIALSGSLSVGHFISMYMVRVADGSWTRLTNGTANEHGPVWSNDGMQIAFASSNLINTTALEIMNADGTGRRVLLTTPVSGSSYSIAWSPDNQTLLYSQWTGEFSIGRVSAAGGQPVLLVKPPSFTYAVDPAWTDNETVVFSGGRPSIWAMDADGSYVQAVTPTSGLDWYPRPRPR